MHLSSSAGNVAGVPAGVGRMNAAWAGGILSGPPMLRMACRESAETALNERQLIDHIALAYNHAGLAIPRSLLVNYYVSLKSNPFVVLAGPEGSGKADFIRLFAQAVVGSESSQYTLVPGRTSWHSETGEGSYYRNVHDRFTSLRFLELLQEAAEPINRSKLYFVSFQRLHPSEIHTYFSTLLLVDEAGNKQLRLPGAPHDRLPIVPPNVLITASVDTRDDPATLDQIALRHASMILFTASTQRVPSATRAVPSAPVGFQRLWAQTAVTDVRAAEARLRALVGDSVGRMRPSPEVGRLLWRDGTTLSTHLLQRLSVYVANSFGNDGLGLFHADPHRNAQIAYDAQLIQRVLWKLGGDLQSELAEHIERLSMPQQAVA